MRAVSLPWLALLTLTLGGASHSCELAQGGRFLRVPRPDAAGRLILDFNRADHRPE